MVAEDEDDARWESHGERADAFLAELEEAMAQIASKHGLDIHYWKSDHRDFIGEIDGRCASDLTHTLQVIDAAEEPT